MPSEELAQKLAAARRELCEAEDLVATLQRRVAEYERQLILETSQQQRDSKRAAAGVKPLGTTTTRNHRDDDDSSDDDGQPPRGESRPQKSSGADNGEGLASTSSSKQKNREENEMIATLTEERKLFSRLTAALEVACLIGDTKSPSKKDGVPVTTARSVMQELDDDEDFGEYEMDLDEERNQVRNLK